MRASLFLCAGLLTAAAIDVAPAQTPTQQPPMPVPKSATPAPVIRDSPGGSIAAGKPPPTPAPVMHDPAGSTTGPLPCHDGTYRTTIDGKPATVKSRLCEQSDGTWAPQR